jgi:hypothetical protein
MKMMKIWHCTGIQKSMTGLPRELQYLFAMLRVLEQARPLAFRGALSMFASTAKHSLHGTTTWKGTENADLCGEE